MTESRKIGAYEIVAQIGTGGMATVYKGYQPRLDRYVAVKVMHKNLSEDPSFRARFEREARIVARLDHPNIVPVYDFDDRDGETYLVMKCVEGLTLKQLLRQGTLSPEEILEVLSPIADALTYAHKQGILHRDIKPSNIIIDHKSVPYLTDFGLARIAQQGESTMSVDMMLGTPHYISPEQAKGETALDARTDVYSLGVVLYELVTGRVPFMGDTSYAIVHDHIYTPPPSPRDINPDVSLQVEAVLLRTLAKNRADRYPTPVALIDAYRKAIGGEPVPASTSASQEKEKQESSALQSARTPDEDEYVDNNAPQGFIARFVTGVGTFGREMEEAFKDFDRDEFGNKLSEEEMSAKKGEAVVKFKESVQKAMRASGFDMEKGRAAQVVEKIAAKAESKMDSEMSIAIGKKGDNDDDSDEDAALPPEERLRRRIEKRLNKKRDEFRGMLTHIIIFVIINSWLFGLNDWFSAFIKGQNAGWPHIVTLLWGIGLVSNILDYFSKYGPGYRQREEQIEQEVEREWQRLYGESRAKAKNEDFEDRHVRLTGDGELTESFIEEQDYYPKRKNR